MSGSRFGQEKGYIHPRAAVQEKHIDKRKRRNKDLEIVFDASSHKDFVTVRIGLSHPYAHTPYGIERSYKLEHAH